MLCRIFINLVLNQQFGNLPSDSHQLPQVVGVLSGSTRALGNENELSMMMSAQNGSYSNSFDFFSSHLLSHNWLAGSLKDCHKVDIWLLQAGLSMPLNDGVMALLLEFGADIFRCILINVSVFKLQLIALMSSTSGLQPNKKAPGKILSHTFPVFYGPVY